MTVVSSDFLAGVLTNFRALFQRDFDAAQNQQPWTDFAIRMPSDGEQNTYEWFGTVPKMENVSHGTASINDLPEYNFSITNDEFQAVIEVSRMAMERDRLGLVAPRISQLAEEAARHPGELIFELFESNPNAFDGTALFANTRTIGGSANVDNLTAGTGTSIAQFQTDLAVARSTMRLFQDDRGRPLNNVGNMLVIPSALEQTVWQALNANQAGDGVNNKPLPASGNGTFSAAGYNVIVNPFLTDTNDWYLLYNGGPSKRPFIYQEEKAPVVESDVNPNTREAIIQRNFLYSVYGRYNVGVTDPRFAVKVVNT